jgi:hypothetical protein
MFKGKLGIVPEIAAYTIGAVIGLVVLRLAWETDAADRIAQIPVIGTLLVTGPRAAVEKAVAG